MLLAGPPHGMARTGSGSEESSPNCPLSVLDSVPPFLLNYRFMMNTSPQPFLSLARKWRPQTFADMVGHEYTTSVLQNAVRQNRLHHAFLFTGTRGVGKTTLARIVAKMVNCLDSPDGEPCLKCDMCKQIAEGRLLDVVELDAASHTKVDEMRELLESALYSPTQGKCKVFIIDEVHMLSKSAFAAMLKTLEEPPDYLKFVLATTDPQKLPPTIMSRCLCFALRPLEKQQIAAQLAKILQAENCEYDEAVTREIARLARGSMRDALSILEQAMNHSDGKLQATAVRRITGEADISLIADILRAVATAEVASLAEFSRRLAADSTGFDAALARLAILIYKTTLFRVAPDAAAEDDDERAILESIAPLFSDEELQTLYEIAVRGRQQLPWAPDEQTGFEMTLLRMTLFSPQQTATTDVARPPVYSPAAKSESSTAEPAAAMPSHDDNNSAQNNSAEPIVIDDNIKESWQRIMSRLQGSGTAHALAEMCSVSELTADRVVLRVDKSQTDCRRWLPRLEEQLRNIIHEKFEVILQDGEDDSAATARDDELSRAAGKRPFVRDMLATTPDARLVADSVEIYDNNRKQP